MVVRAGGFAQVRKSTACCYSGGEPTGRCAPHGGRLGRAAGCGQAPSGRGRLFADRLGIHHGPGRRSLLDRLSPRTRHSSEHGIDGHVLSSREDLLSGAYVRRPRTSLDQRAVTPVPVAEFVHGSSLSISYFGPLVSSGHGDSVQGPCGSTLRDVSFRRSFLQRQSVPYGRLHIPGLSALFARHCGGNKRDLAPVLLRYPCKKGYAMFRMGAIA